jgi:glucosylceramidase
MTASANPSAGAANAVDDDATTRWTTGAPQAPGQWLQVDLGATERIRRVVLDTGADRGDFPRGYTLQTSRDGVVWADAASGAGSGQLTTIDIPPTRARYVRVSQIATAPSGGRSPTCGSTPPLGRFELGPDRDRDLHPDGSRLR